MNLPSGFDTTPDTYCLLLNEDAFMVCVNPLVLFSCSDEVYMQVGYSFPAIVVICELHDFALLMLLTTFPTTNLLFSSFLYHHSLMASGCILMAISNVGTLCRYIASELKAYNMVVTMCDVEDVLCTIIERGVKKCHYRAHCGLHAGAIGR